MTSSSSSSPEIQPAPTADAQERFTYKHATHDEVLEDLSSRFLLNLPDEELSSLERICFQVEQAHWFYEDFVREENPKFPSLPLKKFSEMLFHACPLLHQWSHDHEQAFNTFMQYKTRVPVCGAIMLNESWEKCILVKGWKSSSGWGFPKGKINEDEPSHECAIREVLEETGYNLAGQINRADVIEMSIKEQLISLFIVPGIPEDFPFKTRTRKEISRIEWFKLTDLPTWKRNKAAPGKFYLISPFIGALKAFITARKPRTFESRNRKSVSYTSSGRGAHESGSSSTDTHEPQTPSPQYSEAIPVINGRILRHESDEEKGALVGSLDPHFARLLNSLSISASKNIDPKPPHVVNGAAPLPKTTSPSVRLQTPDWSSRVPTFSETPINSPGRLRVKHTSVRDSQYCERHADIPHASESDAASRTGSGPGELSSAVHNSTAVSTSPVTTARKPLVNSRRSSSIADISPYLTRSAEVPTSGKRLKQLALLESVADESVKMTPTLIGRELSPALAPDYLPPGYPGPSSSVPPPTSYAPQTNVRDLYEPITPVPSLSLVMSGNIPLHTSYADSVSGDPFQVRPRSSQFNYPTSTYPAGVSTRSTKIHNQVTPLMNGPSHVLHPANTISPTHFPQTFPPGYSATSFHSSSQPSALHSIYPKFSTSDPAVLGTTPHSFIASRDPHVPPGAQILSAQSRPTLPSSSVQLLSILNGDRASDAHPSTSRARPPSNGISARAT